MIRPTLAPDEARALAQGRHETPADVLGMGVFDGRVLVRTWQPHAVQVELLDLQHGRTLPMAAGVVPGLFEWKAERGGPFRYRYRVTTADGNRRDVEDPYRFAPWLTDFDLHVFHEGTQYRAYQKMGAHPRVAEGVPGVHFAVWAPNAAGVSVVGSFNRWDSRIHLMHRRGLGGVWELFVPGAAPGDLYKFEVRSRLGPVEQKADPFAFFAEVRPRSASIVWAPDRYRWSDAAWIEHRSRGRWHEAPLLIYEVHAGSWRRRNGQWLSWRELADELIPHVLGLGFTHIELLPIAEHPLDASWGYQTTGYFAPTSRYGTPDEFREFVDRCHQAGLGVIVDWTPAHFPKDAHGLARFDGTALYEHADPRQGEHRDWGTLIFNYGRHEVRSFLLSSAMWWADAFHVDGLRVDAVASMLYLDYSRPPGEWIPNRFGGRENLEAIDFLRRFNEVVHAEYPGFLTIAEESTAWPMVSRPVYLGGLGFDFKWNMGWMHDTLEYFGKDPIYRKYHHNMLTFSMVYAFTENFVLPFSHDEVVHGKGSLLAKMPGDPWQKFANLRLLLGYMAAHPGKKLLFMGAEMAPWTEWDCHGQLDWDLLRHAPHAGIRNLIGDLNRLVRELPALHEQDTQPAGFEWLELHDSEQSVLAFLRRGRPPAQEIVAVGNFTPVPRHGYRIGVPRGGVWREILNTDADRYGGTNVGNGGSARAQPRPWHGRPWSLELTLPPLGLLLFEAPPPEPEPPPADADDPA
ncbi:MAG: 1,4-alpha-glucan branching protein GlgB [Kiritimatiellae bacterium]|nr:1,4-alpha-glucan branching protein GlgB [Kiritimatiellia bacterium]